MDIDYKLRHRNRGTLFRITPEKLHRRLRYLDQKVTGGVSAHQRPDTRPGIDASETVYVLDALSTPAERLIAVERQHEARLQGHASLMSEPAAMPVPRGGAEETCIPIPRLRGAVAYWFAAHAERREPIDHSRDTSGVGPTVADLETAVGHATVREAALSVLDDDFVRERYEG